MARTRFARPRGGIALALSAGCLLMAVPGWASAATIPLDDPVDPVKDTVTKTVESVLDPVRETAKPVTDAVEEATQPVRKPVEDAARTAIDAVKEVTDSAPDVVDPVTDVVDPDPEVTDPVTENPDPPPSTDGVVGGRGSRGPSGREPASARRPRAERPTRATPQPGTGGAAELDVLLRQSLREAPAATAPAAPFGAQPPARSTAEAVKQAALDASRAFRFPLLLAAAMLLFLGIQGRLDARDPKLAAPVVDEELTFA